jgi:hypothetical protein
MSNKEVKAIARRFEVEHAGEVIIRRFFAAADRDGSGRVGRNGASEEVTRVR